MHSPVVIYYTVAVSPNSNQHLLPNLNSNSIPLGLKKTTTPSLARLPRRSTGLL